MQHEGIFQESPSRKSDYMFGFFLILGSALIYGQTIGYPLIWDSLLLVTDNAATRSLDLTSLFTSATTIAQDEFATDKDLSLQYYRPVLQALFALWYQVAGENAAWWHGLAVTLNCLVVVVVYRVMEAAGQPRWAAFAIALLYSVNPGRVESVAWVYGLSNQIFGLFALFAFWAWLKNRRALSVAAWLLCLGTRETAILFPAIILAWEWLIVRTKLPWKWLVLQLAVVAMYLWVRSLVTGGMFPIGGTGLISLINAVAVILQRQTLSLLWPAWGVRFYPLEDFSVITTEVALSFLFLAGLGSGLIYGIFKNRWVAFWLLWALIWMATSLNVGNFAHFLMAEKDNHLIAVAVSVLLFHLVTVLTSLVQNERKRANFMVVCILAISLAHGGLSAWRAGFWKNPETFFSSAISQAPGFGMLHYSLGMHFVSEQRFAEAERAFRDTVEAWPDYSRGWNNLGNARYMRGDLGGAEAAWQQAFSLDPGNAAAVFNLSMAARAKGDDRAASRYLEKYDELIDRQGNN